MATLRTLHMSEESRRLYSPTHYAVGTKSSAKPGASSNPGVGSAGSGIWQTPSKPISGVWGPPSALTSAGSSTALKDQGAPSQAVPTVPAFVSGRTSTIMPMPLTPMTGGSAQNPSSIPMTPPPGIVPRPLSRESLSSLTSSASSIASALGPAPPAAKQPSQSSQPSSSASQSHHQPHQSHPSQLTHHHISSDHHGASRTASVSSKDDEIIPTAIVVKNIPFAIKKEQLLDFMTQLGLTLPYAFNYHFDNGVFRGLAFANFTTSEETAVVISTLNGREIGGRKLRVEYKKMLPYQERERIEREKRERRGQLEEQHAVTSSASMPSMSSSPSPTAPSSPMQQQITHPETLALLAQRTPSASSASSQQQQLSSATSTRLNMNDPETLSIYSSLLLFKNDTTKAQIALGPALVTKQQIRLISALCKQLDLLSQVAEDGVVVAKRPEFSFVLPSTESSYLTGVFEHAVVVPTTSRHSSISSNSGSTTGAIGSPNTSPWAPRTQLPIGKGSRSGDANDKTI